MPTQQQIFLALREGGMTPRAAQKWATRVLAALHHTVLLADDGYRITQTLDALRFGVRVVAAAPRA